MGVGRKVRNYTLKFTSQEYEECERFFTLAEAQRVGQRWKMTKGGSFEVWFKDKERLVLVFKS